MAAVGSLDIEKEGVQELKDPFHHSIFYHQQYHQNEIEHYDFGDETTVDVLMEVQGNSSLLQKKSLRRRSSSKKQIIKKWLKKVLRTGSHTEANVPKVQVNVPIEKKEETDNIEMEMERRLHGENEVVEAEEKIKSINSNSKESLFNEEIDSAENEIKCYTVHFGIDNTPQDEEMYPTEITMVQLPKDDLLEEFKDVTAPQKEYPLPSGTEVFIQGSCSSDNRISESKEADKEQGLGSVKDNFVHEKSDLVITEIAKETDKQQERDIPEVFDEQEKGVLSFDHVNTAKEESEECSTSAEQKGTDDKHKKQLAVFALLSLFFVYLYISICL